MSNFKSGSGNLDFGGSDEDDGEPEPEPTEKTTQTDTESNEGDESTATEQPGEDSRNKTSPGTDSTTSSQKENRESTEESTPATTAREQYPYFIRRSNVGDERDTRLEIHVRDRVADQEAAFRNELAEQLNANEVSKTDAREFALLAAFQHPERVAELMAEEGFGTL
ncbi:acyl-CoA dehydrogenase [Halohasta litorea]|uniref:Acyl-CoA dehydrogenase n=1 Tax=Halohasta litorea TaxID=869891 RepID=A0ABD6DEJ2_9EURY|nr:acyl-CoA dehydrogenase [Halohasta litorea]